ncbi:MAG: hypothetical protein HGB33_02250 [Syntrophaceae bacterium]|nr:hypothetical protein [Syntrophaceae bacterium]
MLEWLVGLIPALPLAAALWLGLAIVRDIVKAHGGKMEIKSAESGGTSIILYLPVSDDGKHPV